MKYSAFLLAVFCISLVALIFVRCDPFQEDEIMTENIVIVDSVSNFYIRQNTSAVINMRAIVKSSFAKITVQVAQHPKRGTVTRIGDSFFYKYTPLPSLNDDDGGEDAFDIVFIANEKTVARKTITINMRYSTFTFPCGLHAIADDTHTNSGKSVSVSHLFNDRLCDIKVSDAKTSIAVNPRYGEAIAMGDSIVYTPEAGFKGVDEIVYEVTVPKQQNIVSTTPLVSYGLITIDVNE